MANAAFVAVFDFTPNGEGQLALKVGDKFINVTEYSSDWWNATDARSKKVMSEISDIITYFLHLPDRACSSHLSSGILGRRIDNQRWTP